MGQGVVGNIPYACITYSLKYMRCLWVHFFILKIHTFLIHLDSRKENVRPFSGDFYLSDDNVSLQRPAGLCKRM